MSEARQRFIEELKLQGLSPNTIDVYVRSVRQLSEYCNKHPLNLTNEEIRRYLLYLRERKPYSVKSYNVAVAGIKQFYKLCQPMRSDVNFPVITPPFILPEVLSMEEVTQLLKSVFSTKYQTIFALMFSSGLRVGECVHLKPADIDSKRMLIRVQQSKRNKDRYTILGNAALGQLRSYFKTYQPKMWLFEGKPRQKPLHIRSVQKVFRKAISLAGIKKKYVPIRSGIVSQRIFLNRAALCPQYSVF